MRLTVPPLEPGGRAVDREPTPRAALEHANGKGAAVTRTATLALLCATLASCVPGEAPAGAARRRIINGTLDTSHQAVVVVAGSSTACTGTIVFVDADRGAVLTAAHCVDGVDVSAVLVGDDYMSSSATFFSVTSTEIHPDYDPTGPSNNFALVWFSGASSSTPVMPVVAPSADPSAAGLSTTVVGYGLAGPAPGSPSSQRRSFTLTLGTVTSAELFLNVTSGGPCSGDSGGPVLADVGGTETVIGVVSYGDPSCATTSVAGRVSSVQPWLVDTLGVDPCGAGGCDAGTGGDAGATVDAGTARDAGAPTDGGAGTDASAARDAGGTAAARRDRGCGCVVAGGSRTPAPVPLGLALLAIACIRLRRRSFRRPVSSSSGAAR